MDIQIRQASPADFRAIARVDGVSFGVSYTDELYEDVFAEEPPTFLVATDADQVVGVAGEFRFAMAVPGGGSLEVPGITWVSVLPTHRRRGILRALITQQLDGFAAAGEPLTVLTASEGSIYRRFGFGPATQSFKTTIERRLAVLRGPVDSSAVEFISKEQATTRLPELHERWRLRTPGGISRSPAWWNHLLRDRESRREGLSEKFYLAHPDGYLSYQIDPTWTDGHATNRCVINDYFCVTAQAHAALWQVLLATDLISTIETWQLPSDDQLPFLLTDPRQVRTTASKDGMWLRPIDLPAMLTARRYQVELEAVIEVGDERVLLQGGPDGASCRPTDRPAQLRLDQAALGSAYLGGHRLRTLARAGLVQCDDDGLLRQAELAFGADRTPMYGTAF